MSAGYRVAGDGMAPRPDAPAAGRDRAAAPDAAAALRAWPPRRRRGRKRTLVTAAAVVAVVVAAGVAERSAVAGSVAVLGHLRWAWMPAVIMLESSSMVAFARMHRRLLADLVLAMHEAGGAFTAEQKARNFDYYERLTVRDSSLSACTQAVIAAEVGHLDLAYNYLGEAALMDLHDLEHNTRDGIHIASLAGTWGALVSGFGGLRLEGGTLRFAPRLPGALASLAFTLTIHGHRLRVQITAALASYTLADGDPLQILHHGQPVTLPPGQPQTRPIPPAPSRPTPTQPPGREPLHRQPSTTSTHPVRRDCGTGGDKPGTCGCVPGGSGAD